MEVQRFVLVLGANGRIGLAVTRAFVEAGWGVYAQIRRDPAEGMPASAVLVRRPIDAPEAVAREAAASTVVVYAINPVYTNWEREALPSLRHGIAIATLLGARLILPGNVYNFGSGMPPILKVRECTTEVMCATALDASSPSSSMLRFSPM
jgi:hypothetical protein